jgi:hypothetical protein
VEIEVTHCGDYEVRMYGDFKAAVFHSWTGNKLASFKGESAWMDAERYASDLYFDEMNRG